MSQAFNQLVISQAITGEFFAIENYARMMLHANGSERRLELFDEANHERGHIRSLRGAAKLLGLSNVDAALNDPYWDKVRSAVVAALEEGRSDDALFIQDFILEAYACTLYAAVLPYVGSVLAPKIEAILNDEREHLRSAVLRMQHLWHSDPEAAVSMVERTHLPVAGVLAKWVQPEDCKPICGVCSKVAGSCGKPVLEQAGVPTEALAASFFNIYGNALRQVGFAPLQVMRWLASLEG